MLSLNELGLVLAVVLVLVLFGQWENVARRLGTMLRRKVTAHADPRMREWAERMKQERATVPNEVCYHMLGLTPSATEREIRRAYRRKAKKFHPDHGGDPDIMDALTMAYEQLLAHKRHASERA